MCGREPGALAMHPAIGGHWPMPGPEDARTAAGHVRSADVAASGRVGIVDIGSNTVRLVVYETPVRLPIPIFNEKAQCGLAHNMGKTGRLDPDGMTHAFRTLVRFSRLAEAMGVAHLEIVATAAVRDAEDGRAFAERAERVCGQPVHVLSGAEEARLAAVGLLNGVPDADGVLGDLGGGSLDLVGLDCGQIGQFATLPVGHLRLAEDSEGRRDVARGLVSQRLAQAPWLDRVDGRTVFAVGGSWRALARIFIEQTHYPLHVLDNYTIGFFDALRLANLIANLSDRTMGQLRGLDQRRIDTLPFAAIALAELLEVARPAEIVFSGFSMREGQMLELLPPHLRRQDPLISACEYQAERTSRFAVHGQEIHDWMTPLLPAENEAERRLRLAKCLLSDIGWSEHPDYRAEHAYHRVLRVPFPGLTHTARARMALAIWVRYGGEPDDSMVATARLLLDEGERERATVIGAALRLAHSLSGGAPGMLSQTRLRIDRDRLALELPADRAAFASEAVERRFRNLARWRGLKPKL